MLLALALFTAPAQAFEVLQTENGDPVRFTEMPVTWTYDDSQVDAAVQNGDHAGAIRDSIEVWGQVEQGGVTFEKNDSADSNLVYWEPNWEWDDSLLAITSTWATDDGEIVGFETRINGEYENWGLDDSSKMDVQNTMTHEIGHALGLDHNAELYEATMFPTASVGELSKRELDTDDGDAIRYLYGSALEAEKPLFACNGTGSAASLFGTLSAMATLIVRRRKA